MGWELRRNYDSGHGHEETTGKCLLTWAYELFVIMNLWVYGFMEVQKLPSPFQGGGLEIITFSCYCYIALPTGMGMGIWSYSPSVSRSFGVSLGLVRRCVAGASG